MNNGPGSYRFLQRFWSKVRERGPDQCWKWQAKRLNSYGTFSLRNKAIVASRLAYQLSNADELLDSEKVLHYCDYPPCCNPAHLFKGTQLKNVQDMIAKGRHKLKRVKPYGKRSIAVGPIPL